jgi:hypothetical protein
MTSRTIGGFLWTAQVLLAGLFLFAGGVKLAIPMEILAAQAHMSGLFLKFIAVAELAGAFGLILPALLRIRPFLTPLAAAGLVLIMVGAVIIGAVGAGVAATIMPLLTGLAAGFVAYGRWRLIPVATRA